MPVSPRLMELMAWAFLLGLPLLCGWPAGAHAQSNSAAQSDSAAQFSPATKRGPPTRSTNDEAPQSVKARPSRVVVVVGERASDQRVAQRLRSELEMAGFEVSIVRRELSGALPGELQRIADEQRAFAAIALSGDRSSASVDVWVVDRVTGKTLLRRIEYSERATAGEFTSVVALGAVGLLKASVIELDYTPEARESAPNDVQQWVPPHKPQPKAAPPAALHAGLGIASMHVLAEAGLAFGPGLSVTWGDRFALAGTWIGPAWGRALRRGEPSAGNSESAVTSQSAVVAQSALLIEGRWYSGRGATDFYASVGAGSYQLIASGRASEALVTRRALAQAALLSLGAGVAAPISARWLVQGDVRWLGTVPQPTVSFSGQEVARGSLAAMSASVSLLVKL